MNDVFSYIWGQKRVRDFLRESAKRGNFSQSYLFFGPAGSGKTQAAFALAAALLCENKGCNECETCKRVMRRVHPDVHFYEPEGAQAYLVEQMRQIISDVARAPISAKSSVYIINRADLLNAASANAFLKTLEEPPSHVTIILIARAKDSVLPTLVSRCVPLPFSTLQARVSVGLVEQNAKVDTARATQALSACSGSVEAAIRFAKKNSNFEHMNFVFSCMASLLQADTWDILKMSKDLFNKSNAKLEEIKEAHKSYIEYNKDYLNAHLNKKLKEKNKREESRALIAAHVQNLDIMRSWLRDVMMLCVYENDEQTFCATNAPQTTQTAQVKQTSQNAGITDDVNIDAKTRAKQTKQSVCEITNKNVIAELKLAAKHSSESRVARGLLAIDKTEKKLKRNVSPQSCTDALLLELKEVLYDANSSC